MIFAIDFDGVIVPDGYPLDAKNLVLLPGVKNGLLKLKKAGHILLLYSARSNKAAMINSEFDPLVRAGKVQPASDKTRNITANKYREMVIFIEEKLPDIFDAIDDGRQGKPYADVYIDNKAIRFGGSFGLKWDQIADIYGE